VAKEEPKDHSERLAVWRGNREKERSAAGKPSVEHTLFEESDPKVLHPSDKKVKKAELCKGCGKMHKAGSCA
jgi:hypothetical protein